MIPAIHGSNGKSGIDRFLFAKMPTSQFVKSREFAKNGGRADLICARRKVTIKKRETSYGHPVKNIEGVD
jgi:hypothetical protein